LGNSLASGLFPVNFDADTIAVRGFISGPDLSRSNSSHFYTYINSRFIRDKVVQHAILQGYRNFMERGRYPVVVMFIDIPPGEVDVNVHPTKHEVRFRDQGKVHDIIHGAVASVLSATPWLLAGTKPTPSPLPHPSSYGMSESRVAVVRDTMDRYSPKPERQRILPGSREEGPGDKELCNWNREVQISEAGGFFSSLTVIGQFNSAYILCQEGADLLLIDQHAAHERVAFELLKAQFAAGEVETQRLLFPETMDFSYRENAILREHIHNIIRLGFDLEPFGGTTWLVKGAPGILSGGDHQRTLRDILEDLMTLGRSRSFADAVEEVLARIACHSVVRGQHPLTTAEIRALFARMDTADFASNCPHGRPVLQRITLGEIEKMFKRG
jgi:DNA mismatch repair protein MutL